MLRVASNWSKASRSSILALKVKSVLTDDFCIDSKNQPLDEAFAYTVSKLRADDCTALLKLLIEVCAMVNKLSVSRVKCFIDHCLQIDDTLITKEIFLGKFS